MLHLFAERQGRTLHLNTPHDFNQNSDRLIWVDLIAPTDAEAQWVEDTLGMVASIPGHTEDFESSARVYEEDHILYLRADFMAGRQQGHAVMPTQLAICRGTLVSVHEDDVPVIRLLRLKTRAQGHVDRSPMALLIALYATDVEYSADVLEDIHGTLVNISSSVLNERRGSDSDAEEFIGQIARQEALNGTIRRNLMDTRRALSFLMREPLLDKSQTKVAQQVLRDIESLNGHTAFIFDKINFLMDAIIGFININQNKVVKIFSVASVAMLPPTLIASIYGMNFEYMPELGQRWGYPMALALMLTSVIIPYAYFRKKGWLK